MNEGERTLAVFIDFENLALGFRGKKDKRFRNSEGVGAIG